MGYARLLMVDMSQLILISQCEAQLRLCRGEIAARSSRRARARSSGRVASCEAASGCEAAPGGV